MKTTVEINDDLLKAAKKAAIEEGITLRELLEQALRNRLLSSRDTYGGFESRGALYEGWEDFVRVLDAAMKDGSGHRTRSGKAS